VAPPATPAPAPLPVAPPATPAPAPLPVAPPERSPGSVLSTAEELPAAPRKLLRTLLLLIQALYLGFYLTALANLGEVDELLVEARLLHPAVLLGVLATSAAVLIPVRLYLAAAVAFDLPQLAAKFARLFPVLLLLDLLWALAPFLLVHYVSAGLALGMSAVLVYLPFSQRSLVLMYTRGR